MSRGCSLVQAVRGRVVARAALREPQQVVYRPLFANVRVELAPEREQHPGPVAGAEGLGSRLFADADNRVYSADIELLPFSVVDVLQEERMQPALGLLRSARRSGDLYLESWPPAALSPLHFWLSAPFGSAAIVAFEPTALHPPSRFAQLVDGLEVVEAARGLTIGLSRADHRLWLVLIEDFAHTQVLFNQTVSAPEHGRPLLDALNRIHFAFYSDPEPALFAQTCRNVIAKLPRDEVRSHGPLDLFEELERFYCGQRRYSHQIGNERDS